jgi:hypothetical protein
MLDTFLYQAFKAAFQAARLVAWQEAAAICVLLVITALEVRAWHALMGEPRTPVLPMNQNVINLLPRAVYAYSARPV